MELLPKIYGKIKILKSNALDYLKIPLEYGSERFISMWVANGTEWVLGARR